MTILSFRFRALSFTTVLLTAPLLIAVNAQANTGVPLPEISPDQISRDIERRENPATGGVEYYAPSFDPFEAIDNIAGTVSLRSNTRVTATDGHILRGGALLDINFFYTTESDDPYDVAGFQDAVFLSGEEVRSTFYNNRIIECSENVKEVVYDKQYYSGASFGLLAGLYRPFPRYRGHRHFGNRGFGYDWRYPRGFSGQRGFSRRNGFNRRGGFRNNLGGGEFRGNRLNRDRDDRFDRRRDRDNRFDDNARREDRGRRGDLRGDRRRDDARREFRRDRDREFRRDRRRDRNDDSRRDEGRRGNGLNGNNPDKSNYSPRRGLNTIKGGRSGSTPRNNRSNNRDRGSANAPVKSRPVKVLQQGGDVKRSERTRSQRSEPSRPKRSESKRSQPKRSKPKRSQPKRSEPKRSQRSERRSSPKRSRPTRSINKATNRSFKRGNARIRSGKKLNFFPQAGYRETTVSVSQRCAREENLSVYIPRDRLDAARYDGLTVLVLDRDGKDIPVYIPPNYIEGFRNTVFGAGSAPQTHAVPPQGPSYGSGPGFDDNVNYSNGAVLGEGAQVPVSEDQNDSRQPRIYGDPNSASSYQAWPRGDDG